MATLPVEKALEAIWLLSPLYPMPTHRPGPAPASPSQTRPDEDQDFWELPRPAGSSNWLPSPTSAPTGAPTSALGISPCSHPVHEATVAMLWLLWAGKWARGLWKRTSCGEWALALGDTLPLSPAESSDLEGGDQR